MEELREVLYMKKIKPDLISKNYKTLCNYFSKMLFKRKLLIFLCSVLLLWSVLDQFSSSKNSNLRVNSVPSDSYGATLVSTIGSNRATGYRQSNKILEFENGYLITYLESDGSNVDVILEHYDYMENLLSRVNIGKADNNHGGAAIAIDRAGYLHILYGPHGTPMRYRRSKEPNQYTKFTNEIEFGEALTYPSILINKNNELIIAARGGTGSQRRAGSIEIWKKSYDTQFIRVSTPVVNREKGYAAFNPSIAVDSQDQIHMLALVHEGTNDVGYGLYQALIYLVSKDGGYTWENSKGKKLESFANVEEIGPFYEGGLSSNVVVNSGVVAISPSDTVLVNFSTQASNDLVSDFYVGMLTDSNWELIRVGNDKGIFDDRYIISDPGVIVATEDGNVSFALGMQDISLEDIDPWVGVSWGHPTNFIVHGTLDLTSGETTAKMLQPSSILGPYWLPNIGRTSTWGLETKKPKRIIFTHGDPNGGYFAGFRNVYVSDLN